MPSDCYRVYVYITLHYISYLEWPMYKTAKLLPSSITKFGVDSSSRLPFRVQTNKQTDKHTDASERNTHASGYAGAIQFENIVHYSVAESVR